MTPAEAAALLTVAAAFDNRKPDADQAHAWAMTLDDMRFIDCREAIVDHYRGSKEWLMPADVRDKVKKLRHERIRAYGVIYPPAHIDPDDTLAIQRHERDMRRQIADGEITNPTPELEIPPLSDAELEERMKEIRAELARRRPTPAAITPGPRSTAGRGDTTTEEESK